MRDAVDDGKKALEILKNHYGGVSKARVIALYTELTSLAMHEDETVTDYIIRTEKTMTALRNAKETVSDGLVIAMILKGLPPSFKPFSSNISQDVEIITFSQFKARLGSYEETENLNKPPQSDTIMKARDAGPTKSCYSCGIPGHFARDCDRNRSPQRPPQKAPVKWCSFHNSSTHSNDSCRAQQRRENSAAKKATMSSSNIPQDGHIELEHSFAFNANDYSVKTNFKYKGLMVDTGATSHITTKDILQNCHETFDPNNHYMELADGSRKNNLVQKVGDAEVILRDDTGQPVKAILKGALYIPSYPHDIFSVKAATKNGAEITLRHGDNKMVKEGATFTITEYNRLFYLETLEEDQVNLSLDVNHWHRILGHCNFNDVYKLENVVKGMEITGKVNKVNKTQQCSTCIEGKSVNSRNRNPDAKANHALELVHTDLVGPMNVKAKDDFKYAITFTDDFSGTIFVCFLRYKSDTVQATEQFLADAAPYGNIKCIRSDNGGEFISSEFKLLLRKKGIRHETSFPYSPHQNGTAERQWRTLFDMARCLLVGSGLPKNLWTYAVRMATYIRNRCFNNRTGQTPFETLTGNKPDLSNMWIIGSECYAYY